MDDKIKYDDFLLDIAEKALYSLDSDDVPFDLKSRKLKVVLVTYIFDDYSNEVTEIDL